MDSSQMKYIIDTTRDGLIDTFADFVKLINEEDYAQASVYAHALSQGLGMFSQGLAIEALARKAEGLDIPEPE